MAKILYVATSDIHLNAFHRPYKRLLIDQGHQVDLAFERRGNFHFKGLHKEHLFNFPREIKLITLFQTYIKLKRLIDTEHYDLIHCHTPIPSFITRIAAMKARSKGCKILYTAHGFHFFKGAPLKNWLFYYLSEYICHFFTDATILLNNEDFDFTQKKMRRTESFLIPGIGINFERFYPKTDEDKRQKRLSMGYTDDTILLMYIAEFIPRKNHKFLINCMVELIKIYPNLKLVLPGNGILIGEMKDLACKLNVSDNIDFIGFRNDLDELSAIPDIGVSVSKQEGLGLGVIEIMLNKIPMVVSRDRGHVESVNDGENGIIFEQNDSNAFIASVIKLINDPQLRMKMGEKGYVIAQKFDLHKSVSAMKIIYNKFLL